MSSPSAARAARSAVPADVAATVAAALPPTGPAANAGLDQANAEYTASRRFLGRAHAELVTEHLETIERAEYLLASISAAAEQDAAWAKALCNIGAHWFAKERESLQWYRDHVAAPAAAKVGREEGAA